MGDIRVWSGTYAGQIGNWNEGHNWLNSAGADAGVVPVATDDVFFTSGSQDVQADTVAASGVTLASLNFGTKWTGSFVEAVNSTSGTTSDSELSPAEINATKLDYANKIGAVSLDGDFVTVNVQATSTDAPALQFYGSGEIGTLIITGGSGTVQVKAGVTVTGAINVIGASGVRLHLFPSSVVSAADITMDSGRIICDEQIDTAVLYGGTLEMVNVDGTTGTITIYEGTCKYKPTANALLSNLIMYGGFFDMRGCNAPTHTITSTTMHSGSMIDERNGLANTTYTNPILVNGGIVKCDLGRQVTVT
tara:strand:- start:531 stop:1448 length:918 start_codon:yes stop_codon:yes gene_type:complete